MLSRKRFSLQCSLGLILAVTCIVAQSASAASVNVADYSWLQLPSGDVTPVFGSDNNVTGTTFGEATDFRWGDYVWLPTFAMTDSGNQSYYAGVKLDQPRSIESVRLQWWTGAGNTVSKYYVDGSNNGTSWTNIGTDAVGVGSPVQDALTTVDVTDGSYQYVRVRFESGDYTALGYGGPGLKMIEPVGSGAVSTDKVNWANTANFGSIASNNFANSYVSNAFTDGTLQDREGGANWTGNSGSWPAGKYAQVDLGTERSIDRTVAIWAHDYSGSDYDVEYSTDGSTFFSVANPANTNFSTLNSIGATEVSFDPVVARYIRMTNAVNATGGFTLINQFLVFSPVPEPSTATLLLLGVAGLMLRRRKRPR